MATNVTTDASTLCLPPLQFPFDGFPDQIQSDLTLPQRGIQPLNRLGGQRKSKAFSPKFFASHVTFRMYDIDDSRNISYVRNISKGRST